MLGATRCGYGQGPTLEPDLKVGLATVLVVRTQAGSRGALCGDPILPFCLADPF